MEVRDLLSPNQVAKAIGVSESSLKRWCDRGLISTERTPGGHRRMPYSAVLRFVREGGHVLAAPELLGLPPSTGQTAWTLTQAKDALRQALLAGEEARCRQIVVDLYLTRHAVSRICDDVLAVAFREIGHCWARGEVEVFEERRACEICSRVVHELRQVVGQPPVGAPLAMGGTLDGDPYTVASSLAELVLRSAGWRAMSLGNLLPFATLHKAIERQRPRLLWVSVSHIREIGRFAEEVNALFEVCHAAGAALVIGGAALTEEVRKRLRYSAYCDNFTHLEAFASTLIDSRPAAGPV